MKAYSIAAIPGDGIGPEVIAEGVKVLNAAARLHDFTIEWKQYPFGADHYLATGEVLTEQNLAELARHDAIYFGACGDERVAPGILEKGLVIAIRMYCDQYINVRPIRLLPGIRSPLRDKSAKDIEFVVIRENTEDFYVAAGSRVSAKRQHDSLRVTRKLYTVDFAIDVQHTSESMAYQIGLVTAEGIRRAVSYAFKLAQRRRRHVTLIDKANVLTDMYSLWREVSREVAAGFPDVSTEYMLVDAAAMWFVRSPEMFDVVAAPNMFGDILTDLGAAIQGGLGTSAGANVNPEGVSMFEPIHGSAPPLKGLQKANPIATIWAGAMMLETIGQPEAAAGVMRAIERNLERGRVRTGDLGGTATTSQVGDDIVECMQPN